METGTQGATRRSEKMSRNLNVHPCRVIAQASRTFLDAHLLLHALLPLTQMGEVGKR